MALSETITTISDTISAFEVIISQAIKENDQASVERLLYMFSAEPDKLHPLLRISNVLETAIMHNRLEIVKVLVTNGACVKSTINWLKQNPLHIAAMTRNKDMIMYILESDADWEAVDENGANCIHLVLLGFEGMKYYVKSDKVKSNSNMTRNEQQMLIEILKIFVDLRLNVNEFTKFNESPLELAAKFGMIDVAKFLIQSGADPYIFDRHGDRLLHILMKNIVKQNYECSIVFRNQIEIRAQLLNLLRWLQSEGIEINLANIDDVTPLQLAINYKLETLVPVLMELTNPKFINTHNQSNLHIILAKYYDAKFGSNNIKSDSTIFNLVKKLLNEGADVNTVDNNGNTPIHIVAKQKDSQLIELMLKYFDNVNAQSHWGETVLHILISNCIDVNGKYEKYYEKFVGMLVSKGADVNMKNGSGKSPVQLAINQKHGGILKILADNGADLKVKNELGDDLFQLLLTSKVKIEESKSYETIVEVLLNYGFDMKGSDKNGHTFLHQATMHNDVQLIKALLKKGADVNSKDKSLRRLTPLHIAIQLSSMNVILCLLNSGANINIKTDDGESPINMASRKGYTELVEKFIKSGVDVNTITKNGDSPLISAVKKGNLEIIKLLLNYEANVNLCNETVKMTALHIATERNEEEVVEVLLKFGANVNARNSKGQTPVHFAARHKSQILEILVKAGGKIYLMDYNLRYPLHEAVENFNHVGLHYLIKLGQDINEVGNMKFVMNFKVDEKNPMDQRKIEILKHLIELHVADLLLFKLDEKYLVEENSYYERCLEEVEKLNVQCVDQLTMYEFMHMSLRNQMIVVKKIPYEFFMDRSIYNCIVRNILKEARERPKLLEKAINSWYTITNVLLPDLCLEKIFDYLKNDTLKIFIECAESS